MGATLLTGVGVVVSVVAANSIVQEPDALGFVISGVVISLLLEALIYVLGTGRDRSRRLADVRTDELQYGCDEFVCLFPEQSLESGAIAVERIRAGIFDLAIPHEGSEQGVLTVSVGLALLDAAYAGPAGDVIKEADTALYRAKEFGRNRTEYAAIEVPSTAA